MKKSIFGARCALVAAAMTALGTPAMAGEDGRFPDAFNQKSSASVGLYLSVPFGGPKRATDWQDKAEYGLAYRVRQHQSASLGASHISYSADLFALRFDRQGFDRFSLSGRDFYLVDGQLSLYADGEDGSKGGSNALLYIGLGAAALVGASLLVADDIADTIENAGDCIVSNTNCAE